MAEPACLYSITPPGGRHASTEAELEQLRGHLARVNAVCDDWIHFYGIMRAAGLRKGQVARVLESYAGRFERRCVQNGRTNTLLIYEYRLRRRDA